MPTPKQEKVIKKTLENLRKGNTKTKGEILREVGYKESVSTAPSIVYDSKGVREGLDPIIGKMIKHRDRIVELMVEKVDEAKYAELTTALDKVTKNIELLSGNPTERTEDTIDTSHLDTLIEELKDKGKDKYEANS